MEGAAEETNEILRENGLYGEGEIEPYWVISKIFGEVCLCRQTSPKKGCGYKMGKNKLVRSLRRNYFCVSVVIFIFVLYLILRFVPIGGTFYLSFHQWDLIKPDRPFVGLDNFRKLTSDFRFREALLNTTIFAGVLVPCSIVLSLLIATAINSGIKFTKIYELIYFIPVVIPMVPASIIWKWMYDPNMVF